MKIQWTVQDILVETGWSWYFLKQLIPQILRPIDWDQKTHAKVLDVSEKHRLVFDEQEHENFIKYLASEYQKNYEILSQLKISEAIMGDIYNQVYQINQFFKSFTESMTLTELSKELGYKIGSLRNKINITKEGENIVGILELPGYIFHLRKAKNQWIINRLEYLNQTRHLGIDKFLQYAAKKCEEWCCSH